MVQALGNNLNPAATISAILDFFPALPKGIVLVLDTGLISEQDARIGRWIQDVRSEGWAVFVLPTHAQASPVSVRQGLQNLKQSHPFLSPATSQYAFAYTVHITNNGRQSVQLIARRWLIVDDNDEVQEVAGEGVIGQKPHIAPGQSFHYTSGAMLQTPFGTMRGDYEMITQSGERFLADIPPFLLSLPDSVH